MKGIVLEIKKIKGLKILTPDGFKAFDGISKISNVNTLKFTLENYDSITVSFDHKFIINDKIIKAFDLIEGEVLETIDGFKTILKIEFGGISDVYDVLEVKSNDHIYYSGGIKSHNCKFIGSTSTLIEGDILENFRDEEPIDLKYEGLLEIFEYPIRGASYIMGVDTAEGTANDESVIQVLKIIDERDIKQVAIYHNNLISPYNYAEIVIGVSEYYNNCEIMLENNNCGEITGNAIWYDYENENICNCDKKGIGIRSTKKSKLEANMLLKTYIENDWLKLYSSKTITQLSKYEEATPGVYKAGKYEHDDFVTALLWALYYLNTNFYDSKYTGIKKIDKKHNLNIKSNEVDEKPGITVFDDTLDGENINIDDGNFY